MQMAPARSTGKGRSDRGDRDKVIRLAPPDGGAPGPGTIDVESHEVAQDASTPDVLDLRADQRDAAATARDRSAEARAKRLLAPEARSPGRLDEALMLAARDRAAAA